MGVDEKRRQTEEQALREQARRASSSIALVRLLGGSLFLPLLCVLWRIEGDIWRAYVAPMALYAGCGLVLYRRRATEFFSRYGAFLLVVDVAFVWWVQEASMALSPTPAAVACFSLGLLSLLVALSAAAMNVTATWVTAIAASVVEARLMYVGGVTLGAVLSAMVVLGLAALTQRGAVARVRLMITSVVDSEVQRLFESERAKIVEEGRGTIERMLREAREQNERLVTLQQDKEVLTSLLVHDLRAPLGAVRANVDWVKNELATHTDRELVDALHEARHTTDRIAAMIGDLLNIERLENQGLPLQRERVVCSALFGRLEREFDAQARARNLHLFSHTTDAALAVEADVSLLTRVLENLTSNALRYTPKGGRVLLEARADHNGRVTLAVRNDGQPIALEHRSRLFEKYVQGGSTQDNRRAGWGLGLYFCRLAVEAHGASLAVVDVVGWSTSFEMQW